MVFEIVCVSCQNQLNKWWTHKLYLSFVINEYTFICIILAVYILEDNYEPGRSQNVSFSLVELLET